MSFFGFDPLDYEDLGALDYFRARRLAEESEWRRKALKRRGKSIKKRAKTLPKRHRKVLAKHWDRELVPFAAAFGQLEDTDMLRLDFRMRTPAVDVLAPDVRDFSYESLSGLALIAAGGGAGALAGAGLAAATFASVAALATASTGVPIAALSGAAATSATLAWLGGGPLAAGAAGVAGGTAVLTGVIVFPALLAAGIVGIWYGSRELEEQVRIERRLRRAKAVARRDEALLDSVESDMDAARKTLRRLGKRMRPLNRWLSERVAADPSYLSFNEHERSRLALLVSWAIGMTAIMQQAPARQTKNGTAKISKGLRRTVKDVNTLLKNTPKDVPPPPPDPGPQDDEAPSDE